MAEAHVPRTCGMLCELSTVYVRAADFDKLEAENAALRQRIEVLEQALAEAAKREAAEADRFEWLVKHSMHWRIKQDAKGLWFAMDCSDGLVIAAEDAPDPRALIDQILEDAACVG